MIDVMNKTTFIGHRMIDYEHIRESLKNAIIKEIDNGCRMLFVGTHGDFDKLALSICRELRSKYCKDLEIKIVLTSLSILNKEENPYFDVDTVFYDIENEYFKKRIIVSNKNMIDECNTLICYVNTNKFGSGAKLILNYAKRKGLNIINLYDNDI